MDEKKMMAAEITSIRKNEPAEQTLQLVADADAAKIDGSTMRALPGEHHFASLALKQSGRFRGSEIRNLRIVRRS